MGLTMIIFLTAVATEATIKVLLSGRIFDKPREIIYSKISEGHLIGDFIRCPYCLSFWIAVSLILLCMLAPRVWFIYTLILCVQRLSNFVDDIMDKIYYGQYGKEGLIFEESNKESNK